MELGQHEQIEEIYIELSRKEFTRLLKALGRPSYSGKGKAVLVPKFILAIKTEPITIVKPDEVTLIKNEITL